MSETPFSAIEPFGAMNGASSAGASSTNLTLSPSGIRSRDRGETVDMARDEMTAELVAERQGPLEIDAGAFLPAAERGAGGGLVGHIDLEDGAASAPSSRRSHGEAAAVAGDGGAERQARGLVMARDAKPRAVARGKRAYVADNAGEHARFLCHQVIRSGPNSGPRFA